jgi:formylglycine-generating enzyme required for sulfatase activity
MVMLVVIGLVVVTFDLEETGGPCTPGSIRSRTRPIDGMEMVYVPAGAFTMGSSDEEINALLVECSPCQRAWFLDEQPLHRVFVDAFWIDRTEVTNAQFVEFLNAVGELEESCEGGPCFDLKSEDADSRILRRDGVYATETGYQDHPVVEVAWRAAKAYCTWAGAWLPTEAQWEKAARGADGRAYPWGSAFDCRKGNFDDETQYGDYVVPGGKGCDGYVTTAPVGSFPEGASPYGVLDMAGNAQEWTADRYESDYYGHSPGRNPQGPASGEFPVMRGGSWDSYAWYLRVAFRDYGLHLEHTHRGVGFRCAAQVGSSSE